MSKFECSVALAQALFVAPDLVYRILIYMTVFLDLLFCITSLPDCFQLTVLQFSFGWSHAYSENRAAYTVFLWDYSLISTDIVSLTFLLHTVLCTLLFYFGSVLHDTPSSAVHQFTLHVAVLL